MRDTYASKLTKYLFRHPLGGRIGRGSASSERIIRRISSVVMGAVESIIEKLQGYPALMYRLECGRIIVDPATVDGFAVSLAETTSEYIVSFEGWHEHFSSEQEALACFAFGLSCQCRLRIHYCGSFPYRWTVEQHTDNGWQGDSTTGLLLFPFWRRRRVAYRQNAIIIDVRTF